MQNVKAGHKIKGRTRRSMSRNRISRIQRDQDQDQESSFCQSPSPSITYSPDLWAGLEERSWMSTPDRIQALGEEVKAIRQGEAVGRWLGEAWVEGDVVVPRVNVGQSPQPSLPTISIFLCKDGNS